MPPITITTLEALARINRSQWEADKAALRSDIAEINNELDTLGQRARAAQSTTTTTSLSSGSGGRPTTPLVNTATAVLPTGGGIGAGLTTTLGASAGAASDYTQAADQATQATVRLTQAQREQQDPVLAQARVMRQVQSDLRAYTLVAGDADPRTQALAQRLEELKAGAQNAEQGTGGLVSSLGSLIDRFVNGTDASSRFTRGLAANLGGFSLLAGGAVAAGAAIATVVSGLIGFAQQGVSLNAQMEQMQVSFTVVLGSATAASQRMQELTKFAETTPFDLPQVVEADRVLQTFGGTALATGKNLTLTGDIAAGTGRDFSDVALWVGRAYDALQNGRPWGEAALRLQEMGAISGNARQRIDDLQASGASGQVVWAAFTQEMARFNGLMDQQSHTVSGLASNFRDELGQSLRTATLPLFDATRTALEGMTSPEMQANLQHTAEDVAKLFDAIGSGGSAVGNTAQAFGNLPVVSQTLQAIGFFLDKEGHGLDLIATGSHDVGVEWNSMLTTAGLLQPAAAKAFDPARIETYSQAVLDADRQVGSLGVVWLDTAGKVDAAGQRISQSLQTSVLAGLKNLKGDMEAALPDVPSSIQSLLTITDDALQRARERVASFGQVGGDVQLAYSKELEEGLGVLKDWAAGNLDACSTAAEKWGTTGDAIIARIQQIRDQTVQAVNDTSAATRDLRSDAQRAADFRAGERAVNSDAIGQQSDANRQANPQTYPAAEIYSSIQSAQQQAALARMQAQSSAYQQAQLESARAQQASQQALSQLELGDRSFLQGQVTQEITSKQLQTAIDRVKANNAALIDATVQSDIAQTQAQTAIDRVRATNGLLMSAQVDAATVQTQAATALERAKSGSQAYIQAQVDAESAQRDAQDALDKARVKAGLIDYTQTAAYQRAREQMITPAELAKTQIEDVYSVVKTGLDTATTLAGLYIPSNAIDKMKQVTQFEDQLLQAQNEVASKFGKDQILKMFDFAQSAKAEIDYYAAGVSALVNTTKLATQPPDRAGIDAALGNIDYIYEQLDKEAQKHGPEEVAKLGIWAQTGQTIVGLVSSAAGAFQNLNAQRFDLRGQINLLFANMDHALTDLVAYSGSWKNKASDANRAIADNAGAIGKDLSDALSPFKDIQAAGMVGSYEIDAAINNVDYALTKMGDLANSPLLQGQSLTRLQQGSSVLGSVFTGLKTALDTLTGLTSLADSTGQVDVGYSLDQFFLTQVPTYADTWEKSMDRIGNASEGVASRVKGAFGVPGNAASPNASAGGHITAAAGAVGGGNTYQLYLTAGSDPVIEDLLQKLWDRINLKQGGVMVGAGGAG